MFIGTECSLLGVSQLEEKSTNRAGAHVDLPPFEFPGDLGQAFVGPDPALPHGIARGTLGEQAGQDIQEVGRFFSTDSAHEKLAGCAQLKLATSRRASLGGDRGAMW